MSQTLEEFLNKYPATKLLVENLEANLDVFGERLSRRDKDALMRTNLIMIRQCLQDFGVE